MQQDRCNGRLKFYSERAALPYKRDWQKIILCQECHNYHIVTNNEQTNSSLDEFVYDEQANANKLIEKGWLCIPPEQVEELRKIMNGGVNAVK